MTDSRCHIVSLTVTEKGYNHEPATRTLRFDHPDIVHDLAHPLAPRSAIGFIVRALAIRHGNGLAPFTVLSCDNLPANGDTTRALVLAFAGAVDSNLADWIARLGAFPNSMVDRIVPKTTDEDRVRISARLGAEDAWPVSTEPFTQWVIEDRFAGPRPQWQNAGATMVSRAEPYETAKLRMLNGSHSTLAYLGSVIGYTTVDQAMEDVHLSSFIESMMRDEIEVTLDRPELSAYRAQLLARFCNPVLKHKLQQIAMDGSQKLPQRLLGTIRDRLEQGLSCERLCFAVAGWIRYLHGHDDQGQTYVISDPLAQSLQTAVTSGESAQKQVNALMGVVAVWGSDLPAQALFVSNVTRHLERMNSQGVAKALQGFGT
jgi:fructuronate reductase